MNGRHEGVYDEQSTPDRPLSEGSSVDDNEIRIHQFASLIHQQQLLISQLEKQGRKSQRTQLEANLYLNPSLPEALRDHARLNYPPAKAPTPPQLPAPAPVALPTFQASPSPIRMEKDYLGASLLQTPGSARSVGSTPSIVQVSSEGSWTPTPQFALDARRVASSPAVPYAMLPPSVSESGLFSRPRPPAPLPPAPISVPQPEPEGNAYQVLVTSVHGTTLLEDIETIDDIYLGVQAVLAIPRDQQVLLYNGSELSPSESLEEMFASAPNPVKITLTERCVADVLSASQRKPPTPPVLPPSLSHSLVLSPSSDLLRKTTETSDTLRCVPRISSPMSFTSDTSVSGSPRLVSSAREPSPRYKPHIKELPSLVLDQSKSSPDARRDPHQPILRQKEIKESLRCESCKGERKPSTSVASKDDEVMKMMNDNSMKQSKSSLPAELEFQATQQVPYTSASGASILSRPVPQSLTRTYSQKPEQGGFIRAWKNGAKSFQRDWPHQVVAVAYPKDQNPVFCCANRGAPCLRVFQLGTTGKELSSIPFHSVQTVAADGELVVIGGACRIVTRYKDISFWRCSHFVRSAFFLSVDRAIPADRDLKLTIQVNPCYLRV
eukprot:TRINITY_DN1444_c0_g1_i2.p1 TRINITY_DN1444_c0_g1~~TRINITY_DN1444_c0_g1_i2.p1  ORF type:complete len:608 (+),score=112.14 TRINITY_DN1444_c0_g1_i2:38-1861(+)